MTDEKPAAKPRSKRIYVLVLGAVLIAAAITGILVWKYAVSTNDGTNKLHPDFPVVTGRYQMTKEWSAELPGEFNRRFEDDSLVIWRPGFTIWTSVRGNDRSESQEERLAGIKSTASPQAFDAVEERDGGILRFCYRLKEGADDQRVAAFYCFAIGKGGHVQMSIHFDAENDIETAKSIWRSLEEGK